ncbi:MAG: methionine--tRNA ligase [Patescibacteria group bacterium]
MSEKKVFVTTAIDYVNAKPHIGHALEKIQADVLVRWNRDSLRNSTYFLSGTDENGLKNVQTAKAENMPVKKYVDRNSTYFTALKSMLNLTYDQFIRTTEAKHFEGSQKLWKAFKPEDICKKKYKGLYCVGCEEFKTEKDLVDGKCPEHNCPPEAVEEENYFFKLSNYQEQILDLIRTDKVKILPEYRKNEVINFIESGLNDLSISRSAERVENWGVPVPGDDSQIMYVWIDALANYITALDYDKNGELFEKYWLNGNERIHIVGKGILRFHAIYWIAMLLSAGLPLPTAVLSHEYLTINGKKISKSLGNVINPEEVVEKYGVDGARYVLLTSLPWSKDGDITWERMSEKYASDLSNNIGNLVQRTIAMIKKYDVKVESPESKVHKVEGEDNNFFNESEFKEEIESLKMELALKRVIASAQSLNQYIDENKPWSLAKTDMEKCTEVLNNVRDNLIYLSDFIMPFMPEAGKGMKKQLETLEPEPLFPRIEK